MRYFLFPVLISLFLSCGGNSVRPALSDEKRTMYDSKLLSIPRILGKNTGPNRIITDLDLPKSGQYGSVIKWSVAGFSGGAAINPVTGKIMQGQTDSPGILTAVITRGTSRRAKTFSLTILRPLTLSVYLVSRTQPRILVSVNNHTAKQRSMIPAGPELWLYTVNRANLLRFAFSQSGGPFLPRRKSHRHHSTRRRIWIRNGIMYPYNPLEKKPAGIFSVLTLNLHTWQEKDSRKKLDMIADAIARFRPDAVCLQECAQHRNAKHITSPLSPWQKGQDLIREDNAALLIAGRLLRKHGIRYRFRWSWAHYGWGVWEEGVAVLTRHSAVSSGERFISKERHTSTIHSRKAVFLSTTIPGTGQINIFSVHSSWWRNGLPGQIDELKKYVMEKKSSRKPAATIVAGDFNAASGGNGWKKLIREDRVRFRDSYAVANPDGKDDRTIRGGGRIDYIFFGEEDPLEVLTSQRYFLDDPALGDRVSDHYGVITTFRMKR